MQIMKIPALNTSRVFQRKLRDNEKLEYKHDTIRQAYDFLGIKDVSLIMHGTCFPVSKNDMGVGSPFNALSKDVIEFEKLHGFTSTQLGPLGEIKRRDISPYASTVWAKNKLFIDLNALSTDEYANLISDEKLAQYAVQYNDRDRNYTYSQFYEAFENYDKVLEEAYENFVLKVRTHDPKALALNKEYSAFKNQNGQRVMKEGLFNALSQIYGTDKFEQWESEIDKNLPELLDQRNLKALDRYKYLINRNGKDIGLYCFTQFLINKQMKEHKDFRKRAGFKYNADQLVGTSKVEEYIYKDASMATYTLEELLKELNGKDNKITKPCEDILKGYERYRDETKEKLLKLDSELKEDSLMAKMGAKMGIKKEVISDNSDASMADMLIKGISMGSIEMEKKVKDYRDRVDKEQLQLAEDFLKFQQQTIERLKEYL